MNIKTSAQDFIGNTPLMELCKVEEEEKLHAKLFAKLEGFNPAGSVKDRTALYMISEAEQSGRLKSGGIIIEPTSGNTGIGIAFLARLRGYKAILTMPDTMSVERRMLLSAYGAQIVLTEGAKGMAGAIEKAEELQAQNEGSVILSQFDNPANVQAHFETTGPEIFRDTDGNTDIFIAAAGTGGTFTGTTKFLKSKIKDMQAIVVEPASSALLSGGKAGAHKIQGIGANFIPKILDLSLCDEIFTVTDEAAYKATQLMAQCEGLLVGISSGAALSAAIAVAKRKENTGKNIVLIMPDSGERYLSSNVF